MQASISTTELLYKLRENRTKHVETYEAAMQVYRQRLITEFESRLAQLDLSHEADEIAAVETYVKLPKPEVHTDDYDRAIAMAAHVDRFTDDHGVDVVVAVRPSGPQLEAEPADDRLVEHEIADVDAEAALRHLVRRPVLVVATTTPSTAPT